MSDCTIGGVAIGSDQPVHVIAELGVCSRGDL